MRIAIIGGGINGIMTAWRLATQGHDIDLFERNALMGATSSASTKLLHGGLRYLENGELRLVYESLHERTWWVERAPSFAHPLRLLLPLYRIPELRARPRWLIGAGLTLYDVLAGRHTFGRHRWHTPRDLATLAPTLRTEGLLGAYSFFDAQMDDHALGLWAAEQARTAGVRVHEHTSVTHVASDGTLTIDGVTRTYDRLVNIAGPWAESLLAASGVVSRHTLDLVRGSHLIVRGTLTVGFLLEVPHERRICFALPYEGATLIGTTEVRQTLDEPIVCHDDERRYLLDVYNTYFTDNKSAIDIIRTFAGVRPLLRSAADPSRATREYAIERDGRLVTVFGGKWTTSRALGARVAEVTIQE